MLAKKVLITGSSGMLTNSAAYTDVDGCQINKEKAYKVNAIGTQVIR
jgi:dTDP-4-dehydrorhamnose reductase